MKIGINIERKHLYGVIVLLTLGFFIIYTIGTPVKKSTGSHPLQQIAVGVGSNPLDSVDSDADGLIDNSDTSNACNGDSVCEVNDLEVSGKVHASGDICTDQGGGVCLSTSTGADSDWIISGNNMYSGVSGNVGIGTNNPSAKLTVEGNIVLTGGNIYYINGIKGLNSGGATVHIPGSVGIGTTNPQAKLHVNGRIKAFDPVDSNDVATKAYVDAQSCGPGNWNCVVRSCSIKLTKTSKFTTKTCTIHCPSGYKLIDGSGTGGGTQSNWPSEHSTFHVSCFPFSRSISSQGIYCEWYRPNSPPITLNFYGLCCK